MAIGQDNTMARVNHTCLYSSALSSELSCISGAQLQGLLKTLEQSVEHFWDTYLEGQKATRLPRLHAKNHHSGTLR